MYIPGHGRVWLAPPPNARGVEAVRERAAYLMEDRGAAHADAWDRARASFVWADRVWATHESGSMSLADAWEACAYEDAHESLVCGSDSWY